MSRTSLRSTAHALSQPSPSSSVITSPPAASEINAVPVQPRRGGRTSFNWDSRQTDCLLEQVRAVLPRGHHEWEKVVANYNALMSESADYNRLKDKFFKLVRTVKPTGKNTKPSHIQQAQEISAEIEGRVHGGLGDGEDDDDAVDRAAQQLALSGDEGEEKEEAVMAPSPSSAASSSSPSSPSMRRSIQSFPSERTSSKRAKPNAEVKEVVQALSVTLSTAISAQMEQSREEAKLAREQMALQQQQMALQQQQMQAQLLQQQQQMSQLIAALANRH